MLNLINLTPNAVLVTIIFICSVIFIFSTIKYKGQFSKWTLFSGCFLFLGLNTYLIYKTVEDYTYISNSFDFIKTLALILSFSGLISIVVEAYIKNIRHNGYSKRIFWICFILIGIVVLLSIFFIIMANIYRN